MIHSRKPQQLADFNTAQHQAVCNPPPACWQVGYGKKTYRATKDLLTSWGHFQLPWAQVDAATPIKPGSNVCVTANVFGLWTAVPLQIV
jgi:uncharacterized protein (UPF0548 family)